MFLGVLVGVDGLVVSALALGGAWVYRNLRHARTERDAARSAELALEALNQNFDDAINNMSQGLCMFNAAGEIVLCNQAYLRMYALSPDVVAFARKALVCQAPTTAAIVPVRSLIACRM